MKKIYFVLVTLSLLSASPVISQQVFKKSFGGNGSSEDQYDFKKMKGDNYLVTGITSDYGAGNSDAYCIMLDDTGNMLWSKTYGTISRENSTKCYGTADNGFLLAFSSYGGSTGKDTGLFIVKCDKKGDIEWSKLINNKEARVYRSASLYEDKKGNYYVLYDWNTSVYYAKTFTLIKMNQSGDILWNKVVNTEPLSTFTSIQIAEAGNGDIVVGGYGSGDNWSTYCSFIHLFLFSKNDGSIKLCNIIKPNNCSYCDLYLSNIVVKNDHIYLAGTHYAKVGGRKIFGLK